MKLVKHLRFNKENEIYFLNWLICSYGQKVTSRVVEKYIKLFPKPLFVEEIKHILKMCSTGYDNYYVLNANSGEIYLFLAYIANYVLKKNKKSIFIATRKYHIDLVKMLYPNIPVIYIQNLNRLKYPSQLIKKYNKKFFILCTQEYYNNVRYKIATSTEAHYFNELCRYFNIPKINNYNKIYFSNEVYTSMLNKIKKINLNIQNFVFIAPCANSCSSYKDIFWHHLVKQLTSCGIDVFFNISKKDHDISIYNPYKSCELSFYEAFYLAQKAKTIVCLRSGFSELLTQTNVDLHVLYTHFGFDSNLSCKDIFNGFSLTKLPFLNNEKIHEYNTEQISEEKILYDIQKSIFWNDILNKIPAEHDHIYFMRIPAIGEAYLFNLIVDELNEKYKAENPCIVYYSPSQKNIFEMYSKIPAYYVDINKMMMNTIIDKMIYYYKHKTFHIYQYPLTETKKMLENYKNDTFSEHYTDTIKRYLKVSGFRNKQPIFSQETINSVQNIIEELNLQKFLFIVPEANAVENLSESFWITLTQRLETKGYKIYDNSSELSVMEAVYLASKASGIIGLRCGFCELLSQYNIPQHYIYTDFKNNVMQADKTQKIFTLHKYPFVNKNIVSEYNTRNMKETEIIEKIVGEL